MKTKKLQRKLNSILEDPAAEPFQPSTWAIQYAEHLEWLKSLPQITRQKYVDLFNEFVPEKEAESEVPAFYVVGGEEDLILFREKPELISGGWQIDKMGTRYGRTWYNSSQFMPGLKTNECKKYKFVEVPE